MNLKGKEQLHWLALKIIEESRFVIKKDPKPIGSFDKILGLVTLGALGLPPIPIQYELYQDLFGLLGILQKNNKSGGEEDL